MKAFQWVFLLFIGIGTAYEASGQIGGGTSAKELSILFIGNSLTYTNDLPGLVRKSAKQKGITVRTKMIAFPNYALSDHWNDGKVQQLIARKKYDVVLVQQGPSSQSFGRRLLIEYGEKLSDLCKKNGTRLCYFMVWPSLQYYQTFAGVIRNHRDAASVNEALLCPVGEAWKAYFDATDNFDYYGPDGFHPSMKGSQAAADVIVGCLLNLLN